MIDSNKGSSIGTLARKGIIMRTKYRDFWVVRTLMVLAVLLIIVGMIVYRKEKVEYTGVPDMFSSFSSNNDYHLIIVANSRGISDKEDFAKNVIEMCRNNSFKSMIFSTDLKGYPGSLDIDVYLRKDDIGKTEPVLQIRFQPDEWNAGYNIRDDVEHYCLYVDDEQIIL